MKRKLKWAYLVFSLLVVSGLTLIRWVDPPALRELRNTAFDQYQRLVPREYVPVPVRIVVLPAMHALRRPLRTLARMILAGTPVRASTSSTPSSGRFSIGT